MEQIDISDFLQCDIRVGTIVSANPNDKARKPAYVLSIDFGSELGHKTSSAQIVEAHTAASLPGRQVLAVVNFPPKRVAGVRSEVLVLAVVERGGRTILVGPYVPVKNGSRLL